MFFKRFFCGLMIIFIFAGVCTVAAVRSGEVETQFVEFKALVPDFLAAPVQIELTDKKTDTVLNYYLYKENNYFNNENVVLGNYAVKVSVTGAQDGAFKFIYDQEFNVTDSTVALPFTIIIDDASLVGDVENNRNSESKEIVSKNDNDGGFVGDSELDDSGVGLGSEDDVSSDADKVEDVSSGTSTMVSTIISFVVSFLIIVVGAIVFWIIKKRNY